MFDAVMAIAGSTMDHFTKLMPSHDQSSVKVKVRIYIIRTIVAELALIVVSSTYFDIASVLTRILARGSR